jgi:hypothetical protein
MTHLSFLMGGKNIQDSELEAINLEIVEKDSDGDRKLKIPSRYLPEYLNLIEDKLEPGFWNEVVGEKEIIFIFKFKDGNVYRYELSSENEKKISELCSQLNGDPSEKTANVYKYISGNSFYKEFMSRHYHELINR